MKNLEYEYSFNVLDIKPFVEYCKQNNYVFKQESKQERIIYRNQNKTMARITINTINNKQTKELDFKEDKLNNKTSLMVRKESKSVMFDDDDAINSILDFLEYKKDNTLIRTRLVYEKQDVKFEIDSYTSPQQTFVVAIEGESKNVDVVYNEVLNKFKQYIK